SLSGDDDMPGEGSGDLRSVEQRRDVVRIHSLAHDDVAESVGRGDLLPGPAVAPRLLAPAFLLVGEVRNEARSELGQVELAAMVGRLEDRAVRRLGPRGHRLGASDERIPALL